MRDARDRDIKAPDGFLLGGLRRVRPDGTVLFQRGYWQCPKEWVGQEVWVHDWMSLDLRETGVEAWPPGVRIWTNRTETVILDRTDRRDAKPGYRNKSRIAWHARHTATPPAGDRP